MPSLETTIKSICLILDYFGWRYLAERFTNTGTTWMRYVDMGKKDSDVMT